MLQNYSPFSLSSSQFLMWLRQLDVLSSDLSSTQCWEWPSDSNPSTVATRLRYRADIGEIEYAGRCSLR
ncbi:MAG: hypothetical protein WBK85_04260 [Petrimonas mucosa]